jgi:hypothetical protein
MLDAMENMNLLMECYGYATYVARVLLPHLVAYVHS